MEQKPNCDSIKGRNSVANLRKMTLYNPKVDLINGNVYTKFGLNVSIRSHDMEKKKNKQDVIGHRELIICPIGPMGTP